MFSRPTGRQLAGGVRVRVPRVRTLSTSPLQPLTRNSYKNVRRQCRFSYEQSKKASLVAHQELQEPENKFDFSKYQRVSYKAKVSEDDAKRIPAIVALHARLHLPAEYEYSTLVRSLTCQSKESAEHGFVDNSQMSLFGANILSFYVTEHLLTEYPRLPLSILKAATEAYVGDFSLYDVAKNSWGIEADETSNLEKYLSHEPKLFRFGRLRFDHKLSKVEQGITKYDTTPASASLTTAAAYGSAVRAIIAGVYAHQGEQAAKDFIESHILSRHVDISSMFAFKEPGRLLSRLLCVKQMEPPTVRLISETGRLSKTPMFVVGCFSGDNLLAEGQGSSLKEARIRSFVGALKAFYLYQPLDAKAPSDADFKPAFIDQGEAYY